MQGKADIHLQFKFQLLSERKAVRVHGQGLPCEAIREDLHAIVTRRTSQHRNGGLVEQGTCMEGAAANLHRANGCVLVLLGHSIALVDTASMPMASH